MGLNLSIKGVPEVLAARLRERAERNHRSLQGELMAIIEQAAAEAPGPDADAADDAGRALYVVQPSGRLSVYGSAEAVRRGHKSIEQIAAERALRPRPELPADLPRAVDIIRADRDSR